ncbi:MAG: hypothetical protein O2845_00145 [Proteobacteria bacterium]|nr:hypothetical protein [Pseudomonadota bacterium]
MKQLHRVSLFVLLLGFASLLFAAEGSVTISSPADGAKLKTDAENKVVYEITPGPTGDHFHIYVDGKEDVVRALKGSYSLPKLSPGGHTITLKVVTKGHVPTGLEKTIKVVAQ